MGRHHNPAGREKKFPCDMCEKQFFEPNHLQRHKRFVHLKERNFHCEECGNSFRDSFAVILIFKSFLSANFLVNNNEIFPKFASVVVNPTKLFFFLKLKLIPFLLYIKIDCFIEYALFSFVTSTQD